MFSFLRKKKEDVVAVENNIELKQENLTQTYPQDFDWDLAEESNLNTAPIQRDNSYETKMGLVKSHLYEKGNITSLEAIKLYNATRLSDVIFKLKQKGLDITTTPETYGRSRFVRYHLNKAIQNEQN